MRGIPWDSSLRILVDKGILGFPQPPISQKNPSETHFHPSKDFLVLEECWNSYFHLQEEIHSIVAKRGLQRNPLFFTHERESTVLSNVSFVNNSNK